MQTSVKTDLEEVLGGFHALSAPIRLQVLDLLQGQELSVCELCDRLSLPQSKLSFHLKTLKEAGLIFARQEGRWVYYRLNLAQFSILQEYLANFHQINSFKPAKPCLD